jgi:hypothetical protein
MSPIYVTGSDSGSCWRCFGIALSAKIAKIRVATPTQAPKISKKIVRMFKLPSPLGWAIPPLWLNVPTVRTVPSVETLDSRTSDLAESIGMVSIVTGSLIDATRARMDFTLSTEFTTWLLLGYTYRNVSWVCACRDMTERRSGGDQGKPGHPEFDVKLHIVFV